MPAPPPVLHRVAAPRRTVSTTVLFVDVVESTRRAIELGDARWLDLNERHEILLQREMAVFGGRCLAVLGDGMLAVFDDAVAAVCFAARIPHTSRSVGLDVRAGLHAGECQRRGSRLGGLIFHIAARVVDVARAGEVLVSRAVTELADAAGVPFVDRGRHRLKGLPGEWALFGVLPVPDDRVPSLFPCTSPVPDGADA